MAVARSRITAQGQISVPAEIRRKLGVGPGAILEWADEGGKIVIRRAGKYTWEDVHKAVFPEGPPRKSLTVEEMDEAIAARMRQKYARR